MEPMAEIPVAWEFIRQLPEKKCKTEVKELITTAFDHLSEAHTHMSSYVTNMSSLTKIMDPDMFQPVLKATAHPLIQVNIPDRYLNPVEEPQLKTTTEERLQKLEKVLLLRGKGSMFGERAKVWTNKTVSHSCLVAAQMQVLQQWDSEGGL